MTFSHRLRLLSVSMAFGALASVGCDGSSALDKAPVTNDLRASGNGPAPGPTVNVARGSVPDDSIRPAPTVNVARGGVADDTIKPMPTNVAKGGTADDGVKTAPSAAPGGKSPSAPKGLTPKPAASTP